MFATAENNNQTVVNIPTLNISENKDKSKGKRNKSAPKIRPKNVSKLIQKEDFFQNSLSKKKKKNYSDDISFPNRLRIFAFKSKTQTSGNSSESNLLNNINNFDLFEPVNSNGGAE